MAQPTPSDALFTRLTGELISEQRRSRRWNMFFRFAVLAYLTLILLLYAPSNPIGKLLSAAAPSRHTALVEVSGVIAADQPANADRIVGALRRAFEDDSSAGVIVRINSPGGSAVQAGQIRDEMRRLRAKHPSKPIYSVLGDIAASGGYYIAVGADAIYADKASLVGSIGVVMNGFGFVETLDKLGVERRLVTAGANKGFMDPFSPTKPREVAHMRSLLATVHDQFIDVVREGRGDRLSKNADLFSGLIWSGEQSLENGLIDALGSAGQVARDVVGAPKIINYTPAPSGIAKLLDRLGASVSSGLANHLGLEGGHGVSLR